MGPFGPCACPGAGAQVVGRLERFLFAPAAVQTWAVDLMTAPAKARSVSGPAKRRASGGPWRPCAAEAERARGETRRRADLNRPLRLWVELFHVARASAHRLGCGRGCSHLQEFDDGGRPWLAPECGPKVGAVSSILEDAQCFLRRFWPRSRWWPRSRFAFGPRGDPADGIGTRPCVQQRSRKSGTPSKSQP